MTTIEANKKAFAAADKLARSALAKVSDALRAAGARLYGFGRQITSIDDVYFGLEVQPEQAGQGFQRHANGKLRLRYRVGHDSTSKRFNPETCDFAALAAELIAAARNEKEREAQKKVRQEARRQVHQIAESLRERFTDLFFDSDSDSIYIKIGVPVDRAEAMAKVIEGELKK